MIWRPRPPQRFVALALVACCLFAACGGPSSPVADDRATGRFAQVYDGVCQAKDGLDRGDLADGRRALDDAHGGLHDLALAAEAHDRAVAARLLEAKQAVEASFTDRHVADLIPMVAAAIRVTGDAAPKACP